jgi:enamine deaminase RidA (YjgF/YER057c/UK114 family)
MVGPYVAVSGTAPIGADGHAAYVGDVYAQTKLCLSIIRQALKSCGCKMESVIRTRIMLTDITSWEEAARAHGETFGAIRPAATFVQVVRFIDPEWLVEVEADCIRDE